MTCCMVLFELNVITFACLCVMILEVIFTSDYSGRTIQLYMKTVMGVAKSNF